MRLIQDPKEIKHGRMLDRLFQHLVNVWTIGMKQFISYAHAADIRSSLVSNDITDRRQGGWRSLVHHHSVIERGGEKVTVKLTVTSASNFNLVSFETTRDLNSPLQTLLHESLRGPHLIK